MEAEVYIGLILSLALCFGTIKADWGDPAFFAPDPIDDVVNFEGYVASADLYAIELDEEVPNNVIVAQLNYTGTETPSLGRFLNGQTNTLLGAVFEQDDSSGFWQLVITNRQDYETEAMRQYIFSVIIGDVTHSVGINIVNIDDNAPVIQATTTSCQIEENWSGLTNCSFLISDADGWIDEITFAITTTPVSGNDKFSMDSEAIDGTSYQKNGYLRVVEELDYETVTMYLLVIVATDGGGNQGRASYIVEVIDMPDEPPKWTNIFSAENILEKSTNYFQVSAIDGDIGINAEISYTIIATEGEEEYFEIDSSSGEITVNPIDRDTLAQEVFRFTIMAYETLDPSSNLNATIIIIVEDINDHWPVVSPDVLYIEIPEETSMTLAFDESIIVTDLDLAENGQYSVALTDDSEYSWSSAFLIIPTSGYQTGVFTISVINSSLLDYEDENWRSVNIQIVATEVANASHIGTRDIVINLTNWNDELPIFVNSTAQTVEVPEDVEMGYLIGTMLATDRDIDDNVTHAIVSQRTLIIDPETAEITTNQDDALDYETIPVVIVQVTASDLGGHVAYATLTINVIDVNDVPPTLTMPRINPSIDEEGELGEEIDTLIFGNDVDTAALLTFSIDWDSSYAHKSGVVVEEDAYRGNLEVLTSYPEDHTLYAQATLAVSGRLDYEQFDVIYLTIVVTDETTVHNDNSTSATLTLRILDINDNAPVFEDPVELIVTENQVSNILIGNVQATDADGPGNNNVTYYIEPIADTIDGLVWINAITGVMRTDTDGAIDAEVYEYLYYNVTATDGYWNTTMTIEIYVTDQNDETPQLNETAEYVSTIYLREKSDSGTEIVTVPAFDLDRTSPFNNVSYLINSDYGQLFSYFSMGKYTGLLEVALSDGYILDRDYGTASFTVFLVLRDNFLVDGITWNSNWITTSVNVILLDINDQIPELPELDDPAATVSESAAIGVEVLSVTAYDADEPDTDNTRVFYEILSITPEDSATVLADDCTEPFVVDTIDNTTASISVNCDLKGYYGTWAIELYAQDYGTDPSPQNDTKTYKIFVEDYNYNDPVIVYPVADKRIRLSRTQTANSQLYNHDYSLLTDFEATDEDSGLSGAVTFSLSATGTTLEYFTLVSVGNNTAQLQLTQVPTDFEENYSFEVELLVTDRGTPNRTTSQKNTVIFISTEGPEFDDNEWLAMFKENTTGLGTSVLIPEAYDMVNIDAEDDDLVTIYYFFTSNGDMSYFSLDKETRNLTLISPLDRESQGTHNLYVVATTSSEGPPESPRDEATLNITIMVLDVNDNPPTFESSSYFGGITPEDSLGKTILTVLATDPDLNETLTYFIVDDSMTYSDSSISSITDPFAMDEETGILTLQFVPLSTMTGFFDFDIVVYDAVNHTDIANVKVYVVAESNRVEFTFRNTLTQLNDETAFVITSFTNAFGYQCNVDYIEKALSDDEVTSLDNETIVTTHFIDQATNLPTTSDVIILASSDLQTVTDLKVTLLTRSLILIDVPSASASAVTSIENVVQSILIIACVCLFLCCVALLTAYIIRTRRLNDRLDKLAVTNFGSHSSGLNRIGVVPMTNKFAIEGSNPMWNTQEKVPEDRISQYSNDSDLIGIENHPNFSFTNPANNNHSNEDNNIWNNEPRDSIINPVIANHLDAMRLSRNPMALHRPSDRDVPTTDL